MDHATLIQRIFADLSSELQSLTDEDLKKLSGGDYRLSLRITRTRSGQKTSDGLSQDEKESLLRELAKAETREDGMQVIEDALNTRKELESVARFLDISVLKQDKVASIREKIVEATIGARLRSEAIKGKRT
ncbi:hypothetical protein [Thiohalocapsa halophila]|uniref:hypothetical protein n=1 Tax=Thiohalocapsa halophila TaxID=69359 RepID=UPI00190783B7|nr:hypothetical protein [Thiohalocapsa halophila]